MRCSSHLESLEVGVYEVDQQQSTNRFVDQL